MKKDIGMKPRREGTVPASKLLDILMKTCGEEHGREKFNELIGDMIEEQEGQNNAKTVEKRG